MGLLALFREIVFCQQFLFNYNNKKNQPCVSYTGGLVSVFWHLSRDFECFTYIKSFPHFFFFPELKYNLEPLWQNSNPSQVSFCFLILIQWIFILWCGGCLWQVSAPAPLNGKAFIGHGDMKEIRTIFINQFGLIKVNKNYPWRVWWMRLSSGIILWNHHT